MCYIYIQLKGNSQFWDRADLDTSILTLKYASSIPRNLLQSQCFFECAFAHPMILTLSYLVKNSMVCVSVIRKLAMKWYLMRMWAS